MPLLNLLGILHDISELANAWGGNENIMTMSAELRHTFDQFFWWLEEALVPCVPPRSRLCTDQNEMVPQPHTYHIRSVKGEQWRTYGMFHNMCNSKEGTITFTLNPMVKARYDSEPGLDTP